MTPEPVAEAPATKAYRLKEGLKEVVRAGLVARAGETLQLQEAEARRFLDVLEEGEATPILDPKPPRKRRGGDS